MRRIGAAVDRDQDHRRGIYQPEASHRPRRSPEKSRLGQSTPESHCVLEFEYDCRAAAGRLRLSNSRNIQVAAEAERRDRCRASDPRVQVIITIKLSACNMVGNLIVSSPIIQVKDYLKSSPLFDFARLALAKAKRLACRTGWGSGFRQASILPLVVAVTTRVRQPRDHIHREGIGCLNFHRSAA
jgi:hypothetical protein